MASNQLTTVLNQVLAVKCFGSMQSNKLPQDLIEAYINLLHVAAKHSAASVDEIVVERVKMLKSSAD